MENETSWQMIMPWLDNLRHCIFMPEGNTWRMVHVTYMNGKFYSLYTYSAIGHFGGRHYVHWTQCITLRSRRYRHENPVYLYVTAILIIVDTFSNFWISILMRQGAKLPFLRAGRAPTVCIHLIDWLFMSTLIDKYNQITNASEHIKIFIKNKCNYSNVDWWIAIMSSTPHRPVERKSQ
jgi:hypothetical protein